jgi:hypothetical protein
MATLHKPDQILAGIMSIHPWVVVGGNKATGESLCRINSIDDAVKAVEPSVKDATKLNVKLERCK